MKRLIYRLSSLGDVILSQTALNVPSEAETYWVVAAEYADLLRGNPKIHHLISFDRKKAGFFDWISLNRKLALESFDEVLDLHATLRTRIARWVFWISCFLAGKRVPRWKKISKSRMRRFGYVALKGAWPRRLFPKSLRNEFLRAAGANSERALSVQDLRYLLEKLSEKTTGKASVPTNSLRFGLMPGSAWVGKKWPTASFFELISKMKTERPEWMPVIFGDTAEAAVRDLCEALERSGIPYEAETGKKPYSELARSLTQIDFLISNDTGLAHLAEGLGKPVVILYGPTTPEFGFGPGLLNSKTVGQNLWCRPCGKDGSSCFRIGQDRYACIRGLGVSDVLKVALEVGEKRGWSR